MDQADDDLLNLDFLSILLDAPKTTVQSSSGVPLNSGLVPENGAVLDSQLPDFRMSSFYNHERKNIEAPGTMPLQNGTDKSNGLASATTLNLFSGNQSTVAVNPQQRQETATYAFNPFSQTFQTNNPTCSGVSVVTLPQNGPPGMMAEKSSYRKQRAKPKPRKSKLSPAQNHEDKVTPRVEQPAEDNGNPSVLPVNNGWKTKGRKRNVSADSSSADKPKKLFMYENPNVPKWQRERAWKAKLNRGNTKEKMDQLVTRIRYVDELESQLSQARQNEEYLKQQLEALQTDSNLSLRAGIFKRNVEETVLALNEIYGGPTRVELPQRLDQIMVRVTNNGDMKVIDNSCAHPLDQLPSLPDAFNLENIEFDYNPRERTVTFK